MKNKSLDTFIDNMLMILPMLFRTMRRKVVKADGCCNHHISPLQGQVLRYLYNEGKCHGARIAGELLIPRPQMTYIVDTLVESGLVERLPDPSDRRIINIVLTDKGKEVIKDRDNSVKKAMKDHFEQLSDEELIELEDAILRIKNIFRKLEENGVDTR